jgi:hypothetical protein
MSKIKNERTYIFPGNCYRETKPWGDVFVSYAVPVAVAPNGEQIFYVNSDKYSRTTSRHVTCIVRKYAQDRRIVYGTESEINQLLRLANE